MARESRASPIIFGTTVLLTGTVVESIVIVFGHCPTCQVGEDLSKRRGGSVCIDSEQVSGPSCLT